MLKKERKSRELFSEVRSIDVVNVKFIENCLARSKIDKIS